MTVIVTWHHIINNNTGKKRVKSIYDSTIDSDHHFLICGPFFTVTIILVLRQSYTIKRYVKAIYWKSRKHCNTFPVDVTKYFRFRVALACSREALNNCKHFAQEKNASYQFITDSDHHIWYSLLFKFSLLYHSVQAF